MLLKYATWYHMHQGLFKREKCIFARTTLCTQIPMNNNVMRLVIDSMRDCFCSYLMCKMAVIIILKWLNWIENSIRSIWIAFEFIWGDKHACVLTPDLCDVCQPSHVLPVEMKRNLKVSYWIQHQVTRPTISTFQHFSVLSRADYSPFGPNFIFSPLLLSTWHLRNVSTCAGQIYPLCAVLQA